MSILALCASPEDAFDASQPVVDYSWAERLGSQRIGRLMLGGVESGVWLTDGRFAYRTTDSQGTAFRSLDPSTGLRQPLFDNARLAAALSSASGDQWDIAKLASASVRISPDGHGLTLQIGSAEWRCDVTAYRCSHAPENALGGVESPDRKSVAFVRDFNLWVRDVATGQESQLTTDGAPDFGYATDNDGYAPSKGPILAWSPDSRKIATFQADERGLRDMYLVRSDRSQLSLVKWKYAVPSDKTFATISRVIIDLDRHREVRLQGLSEAYHQSAGAVWGLRPPPESPDSTFFHDGGMADVQWTADSHQLAYVSTSRDHKVATFHIADAATGAVRDVFHEEAPTYFTSILGGVNQGQIISWRYLDKSDEVIWFSERDGWAHLYLYDAETGRLENQITHGDWNVASLLHVDEARRQVYFLGVGREAKENPYFTHLYRAKFDGRALEDLTPEAGNHSITMAPSGAYFVDTYSSPSSPPVSLLKRSNGTLAAPIERADISRLVAAGWRSPVQVSVKARDGKTDLFGLMYRPTDFDPRAKYPVVDWVYSGPWLGSIKSWSFTVGNPINMLLGGDPQELAELGFIVVAINGMGTPGRSREFRDLSYGNLGDATLPDQVSGLRELGRRYPWIDLSRVGIVGQSVGGYASARAMLVYPDFFKVGVSASGIQNPATLWDEWGDMYGGERGSSKAAAPQSDEFSNIPLADKLRGDFMLMYGSIDQNVFPYQSEELVSALIEANKDFDLVILPNQAHVPVGKARGYATRKIWDFLVVHLGVGTPPRDYEVNAQ